MYKVITLTGLDRTGKATQAYLLSQALQPAELASFPDYTHWTGQIIRAILSEEEFEISRWQGRTRKITTDHSQVKEPYLFQALQFANNRAHYARLMTGLTTHHWVLDRGPACAHAYGAVDGCRPQFLQELSQYAVPEDLVLVLLGGPYARPGEVPDLNERDPLFQAAVASRYRELCQSSPGRWVEVPLDLAEELPELEAITLIHHMICQIVRERLGSGLQIRPLGQAQVSALLQAAVREEAARSEEEVACDGC